MVSQQDIREVGGGTIDSGTSEGSTTTSNMDNFIPPTSYDEKDPACIVGMGKCSSCDPL